MASKEVISRIMKEFGMSRKEAEVFLERYGADAVDIQRARQAGDGGRAYEMSRQAGSFGRPIESREAALINIMDLGTDRAYSSGIDYNDLMSLPQFDEYFNTYRTSVRDPKTGDLRKGISIRSKTGGLKSKLTETARPNETTKRILDVEPFVEENVTGSLIDAAMANDKVAFAKAMSQRISNQMRLLRRLELDAAQVARKYGITDSQFYATTKDLHTFISNVTGIPRQMIASAMAVASSGSSPYDELLKLSAAVPYMKMGKNGVRFDTAAALKAGAIQRAKKSGKYTGDPVYRVAKALERAMNGLDPLSEEFAGLALKTHQYRNLSFNPDLPNIGVSDRIQQRAESGSANLVDATQGLIQAASPTWVGTQGIAAAEGTTAAVPQEGAWFAQRVSELIDPLGKRKRIGEAFPISADEVQDMFTSTRIPGFSQKKVEGRRIGKAYKVPRGGRTIDPEAVDYAQQFANLGVPTIGTPTSITALPPALRTQQNIDLTQAGLLLGQALGPVIKAMKNPRTYALLAMGGLGTVAAAQDNNPLGRMLRGNNPKMDALSGLLNQRPSNQASEFDQWA